jgi:small subunit ribosomal protein S7
MSRRRKAEHREVLPDAQYGDMHIAKFMNVVMEDGKKSVAEAIVYRALMIAADRLKAPDAVQMFHDILNNVRPHIEVRSRRVGGATYQVPVEVRPQRSFALAYRWIKQAADKRGERTMEAKLAAEFMDAANNRGSSVKKRDDTHRMAEANRAFAHFRW